MSDPEPVNRNIVAADFEQFLRERGAPVRCCEHWPECSHMLDWYEKHERVEAVSPADTTEGTG